MLSKTVYPSANAENAVRRYLKQVNRRLLCPHSQKKEFLTQLESDLFLFSGETEDADWNALVAQFGTPENAADEFMASLEPGALWKYQRGKNHVMLAIVCITAALILAMRIHSYIMQQSFYHGYVIETITIGPEVPTDPDNPPLWTVTFPAREPENTVEDIAEK